jgi:N-acetylmuramoyl-L-alanine amidase
MLKISKAATFAAIIASISAAAIYADPIFAFGNPESTMALSAETVMIDPAVLASDLREQELAAEPTVAMTIEKNGDVMFTPGIGNTTPMAVPENFDAEMVQETERAEEDVRTAGSLAELVRLQNTGGTLDKQAHCLAGAVYFESKGESLAGQLAVAKVVMARAKSGRFASTLCGVVFQKSQFSFIRGGQMPNIDKNGKHWKNAVAISKIALNNAWKSPVDGALYFHARYVSPGWKLQRIGSVDQHVFYR